MHERGRAPGSGGGCEPSLIIIGVLRFCSPRVCLPGWGMMSCRLRCLPGICSATRPDSAAWPPIPSMPNQGRWGRWDGPIGRQEGCLVSSNVHAKTAQDGVLGPWAGRNNALPVSKQSAHSPPTRGGGLKRKASRCKPVELCPPTRCCVWWSSHPTLIPQHDWL